jgi:hypothetical protein
MYIYRTETSRLIYQRNDLLQRKWSSETSFRNHIRHAWLLKKASETKPNLHFAVQNLKESFRDIQNRDPCQNWKIAKKNKRIPSSIGENWVKFISPLSSKSAPISQGANTLNGQILEFPGTHQMNSSRHFAQNTVLIIPAAISSRIQAWRRQEHIIADQERDQQVVRSSGSRKSWIRIADYLEVKLGRISLSAAPVDLAGG